MAYKISYGLWVMTFKLLIILLGVFLILPQDTHAQTKQSASSASIIRTEATESDNRAKTLEVFLLKYNSPLAKSSEIFVQEADDNGIDWRLLAAISGVESTFGRHIPSGTNNAWGWGIYGTHRIYFTSFDEGIKTISQALREKYIDRLGTDNVYAIGRVYAASPTWAARVTKFMNMIQETHEASTSAKLSITL